MKSEPNALRFGTRPSVRLTGGALALLFVGLLLTTSGCKKIEQAPPSYAPVSSVPIEPGKPVEAATSAPRVEIYYGEGSCAPQLPNGMFGTCINNTPCNGFGFRDEKGSWQCACFETQGGCGENEACSFRKRSCVRIDEADFLRPPAQ